MSLIDYFHEGAGVEKELPEELVLQRDMADRFQLGIAGSCPQQESSVYGWVDLQ
jgi:hypothetical protein